MVELRWPDGVCCPTCGRGDVRSIATRRMWECKAVHSRKQFSAKIGTIFEDSPLGLEKWFSAIWMIANCKNGVSQSSERTLRVPRNLAENSRSLSRYSNRTRSATSNTRVDKRVAKTGLCISNEQSGNELVQSAWNSMRFRSNRELGWHLTEWPDMSIAVSEKDLNSVAATPSSRSALTGAEDFSGMSMTTAVVALLTERGEPMTTHDIVAELAHRDYPFVSSNRATSVINTIRRRTDSRGDVRRVATGIWALTDWYTSDELEEIDEAMGGKDGKDINGSSQRM